MAEYRSNYTGEQIDAGIAKANTAVQPEALETALGNKQDTLVSGENIKTINNQSILGEGNIEIQGGGGGAETFTIDVSANAKIHEKTKAVADVSNISRLPSWSDIEEAIEDEKNIEINLDLISPDNYLNKYCFIDDSQVYGGGSVELIGEGEMVGVELTNLSSGSKEYNADMFELTISTQENKAGANTYNRLVIEGSMGVSQLYVQDCYYGSGKDTVYLNTYNRGGVIFTDTFEVSSDSNFPVIHMVFSVNEYIDSKILSIGYERHEDIDEFQEYMAYRNDDEHTGGTLNYKIKPQINITKYGNYELQGNFEQNINKIKCTEDRTVIDQSYLYEEIDDLKEEVRDLQNSSRTLEVSVYDSSVGGHADEDISEALYSYDDEERRYILRNDPLPIYMRISTNNEQGFVPACLDWSGVTLPYSSYSYNEIDNAIKNVKLHSQFGNKAYTVKTTKELQFDAYPDDYYDTSEVDTSGMLAVTATYDWEEGTWTFNKPFSEIFSNETKQSGILLTIVNMYDYDSDRGYDVEYDDKEGEWNPVPIQYTQPLVFRDDHFIGTYSYTSEYHEGYGTVQWESTVAIEVYKHYVSEVKDLAAIPTVSIIGNLTTNINGFELQTFTASALQTAGGYSWYEIERNNESCSYEDAADYMEYMTGSRFVPMYNFEKPLNSILIFDIIIPPFQLLETYTIIFSIICQITIFMRKDDILYKILTHTHACIH